MNVERIAMPCTACSKLSLSLFTRIMRSGSIFMSLIGSDRSSDASHVKARNRNISTRHSRSLCQCIQLFCFACSDLTITTECIEAIFATYKCEINAILKPLFIFAEKFNAQMPFPVVVEFGIRSIYCHPAPPVAILNNLVIFNILPTISRRLAPNKDALKVVLAEFICHLTLIYRYVIPHPAIANDGLFKRAEQ